MVRGIVFGSHCFLGALAKGRLIGTARALSDGVSDAYIQDVIVDSEFRGRGVGTRLVETVVQRLKRDGVKWIGLVAENGSEVFYEQIGFSEMEKSVPMLRVFS